MVTRDLHPPGRWPKRVLAIRMLTAKLNWLDGALRWQNGGIVWQTASACVAPDAATLAHAQRCLNTIAHYPISAELALHGKDTWIAERQNRLELAKLLRELSAPDLSLLAEKAVARDEASIQKITRLVIAEALCINPLPLAPSRLLLSCGAHAALPLQMLLSDPMLPMAAHILAAMTLGALTAKYDLKPVAGGVLSERLRSAYHYSLHHGLPEAPALLATFLTEPGGEALAQRYLSANSSLRHFAPTAETLREFMAKGMSAEQVVTLLAPLAGAESLARTILTASLPDKAKKTGAGYVKSKPPLPLRQAHLQLFRKFLFDYLANTVETEAIHSLLALAHHLCHLVGPEAFMDALHLALAEGLTLSPMLQSDWLNLLWELRDWIWERRALPSPRQIRLHPHKICGWLESRWWNQGRTLFSLLKNSQDIKLVREAVELSLHEAAYDFAWNDLGLYRWLLTIVRFAKGAFPQPWMLRELCRRLDCLGSAAAVRATLQPLLNALQHVPPGDIRDNLLRCFLSSWPYHNATFLTRTLTVMAQYVPSLAHFARKTQHPDRIMQVLNAVSTLHRTIPERAKAWLPVLLTCLLDLEKEGDNLVQENMIGCATPLAAILANENETRFRVLFRAIVRRTLIWSPIQIDNALNVLSRFPTLLSALSLLFPQQMERCGDLLVRLGLTTWLGTEVLTPLDALNMGPGTEDFAPEWIALLECAPPLAPLVSRYHHAQRLLHRDTAMPSGVRRALEGPHRQRQECDYLERILAEHPERTQLAARVAKLHTLLVDPGGEKRLRQSIGERLAQAVAEAEVAALEQQIGECYRLRLESITGPLPANVSFDATLMNATLLTCEITQNRRLLLRLLRAYLAGEQEWRLQHPGNAAFLRKLEAASVDVKAWLDTSPRTFRMPKAAGGRIRLFLEGDPLHILQMGNYFNTCLSVDGCNAFSTVANACELNKRVVYAMDGAGRVVGRKLIGINADGDLIGFRTYTTLTDVEGNQALRALFRSYLKDFAARCRLRLADMGTVPKLFAEAWYNDGVVAWDSEEDSLAVNDPSKGPSANRPEGGDACAFAGFSGRRPVGGAAAR